MNRTSRISLSALAGAFAIATVAQASGSLVSTDWVMNNNRNPDVRVAEVSVEPGLFERGHVPGAVNLRWHTDLVDPVRRDLVSKEGFEALLSRHGISRETTVVLYGNHNNWFAAWGVWVFNYYGHDNVKLMDGGRTQWEKERRTLSTNPVTPRRTEYRVTQVHRELRARLADVLDVAEGNTTTTLVDIRSPDEYTGRIIAPAGIQELSVRAGHIPGAINVPWGRAVNADDGTFLPSEELRKLYASVGVDGSRPVITYCRIGERSSHTWFALKHILGYEVKNYDGSWTEYGNSVGVPIQNPAGTVWTGK